MSSRMKLWLFPALLYAVFVFWYTDFGGPLSDEEVDQFIEVMTAMVSTRSGWITTPNSCATTPAASFSWSITST